MIFLSIAQSAVVGDAIFLQTSLHAKWMSTRSDDKKLHRAASDLNCVASAPNNGTSPWALVGGVITSLPFTLLHAHLLQQELRVPRICLERYSITLHSNTLLRITILFASVGEGPSKPLTLVRYFFEISF